jgi:1,4-dihydroxy-2-naphthoyl-CoA synthase
MERARALGLLARTAPAQRAEAAAVDLARELAALPPDGLRALKAAFAQVTDAAEHVEDENAALIAWQRAGGRIPRGGLRG